MYYGPLKNSLDLLMTIKSLIIPPYYVFCKKTMRDKKKPKQTTDSNKYILKCYTIAVILQEKLFCTEVEINT